MERRPQQKRRGPDTGQTADTTTCPDDRRPELRFAADATVGRLVKWLRMAGFDTVVEAGRPEADRLEPWHRQGRWVLTRSRKVARKLGRCRVLWIQADRLEEQLVQVASQLGLCARKEAMFRRCLECNTVLQAAGRDRVRDQVPEYVWLSHRRFSMCPTCRRIYWPGTHVHRSMQRINRWLNQGRGCKEERQP